MIFFCMLWAPNFLFFTAETRVKKITQIYFEFYFSKFTIHSRENKLSGAKTASPNRSIKRTLKFKMTCTPSVPKYKAPKV
jgi:hypothetical protein